MHIEHSLGDILGTETSVTYYGLEAKSDAKEVNERVAEGVKRLTDVWAKCAVAEEITLNSAEKELAVCKENVELASRLDPGVLDQIVIALEETEAD